MDAATGLGVVPFFFVDLDPQWAGICNGMAAGEGQTHCSGSWVVIGILAGGIFILLCKKFLEHYGEVSMMDIKGADARKVVLVIGIMTLHSFGEGSGVEVSFAGFKGFSQGLLITLVIVVHNIPERLAVSMVLATRGVSPQNAMLWSVITYLPQEASPSQVASVATLSTAFMVALGTLLENISNLEDASGFLVSLLFGLGPLIGGVLLVAFALASSLQHALLTGLATGIAFVLASWRPSQLLVSSKVRFFPILFLLSMGSSFFHISTSGILKLAARKKNSVNDLSTSLGFSVSALTLQSFLACGAIALHALSEEWLLVHMVLHVSLHGVPRGAAVASCINGATNSWRGALAATALNGFASPVSAIGVILAEIDYNGLDYWMALACGALLPGFGSMFKRAVKLDMRLSSYGLVMGLGFASLCLASTRLFCLRTPYCNSAPEAVR
ncbi:hypothetical protein MKX01_006370 [Papaver californicum]|nr:hypothetical protein MKX01_006370 [Papaver californicum]